MLIPFLVNTQIVSEGELNTEQQKIVDLTSTVEKLMVIRLRYVLHIHNCFVLFVCFFDNAIYMYVMLLWTPLGQENASSLEK